MAQGSGLMDLRGDIGHGGLGRVGPRAIRNWVGSAGR